jgi:DNA-binding MarR family transcriptional regulator
VPERVSRPASEEAETAAAPAPARDPWCPPAHLTVSPLMHQLARTFWAFKQVFASAMGISVAELGILALLDERDGLTQQELTTTLRVDPSMITRTVKEMERAHGWITRARDPHDNRLMRVYLTDTGRQRAASLPEHARGLEDRLTRVLSDDERAELWRMLRAIEFAVRDDQGFPPAD